MFKKIYFLFLRKARGITKYKFNCNHYLESLFLLYVFVIVGAEVILIETMDENTIEYWKEKYEDLNAQYDEFQKNSYELENEMELQLKQAEDQIKDLQTKNSRLGVENETLKVNTHLKKKVSKFHIALNVPEVQGAQLSTGCSY